MAAAGGFQFQGSNPSRHWTGYAAMRARRSVSQACGSMSFIFTVTVRLYIAAACSLPRAESAKHQDFPPSAMLRKTCSAHSGLELRDEWFQQGLTHPDASLRGCAIVAALDLQQAVDTLHGLEIHRGDRRRCLAGHL